MEGQGFTLKEPYIEMLWVNSGSFFMGSPLSEEGRKTSEVLHKVNLLRGFWLSKFEITQGQWHAIMGGEPSYCDLNLPVTRLSWVDAMKFCSKLNDAEMHSGRLPSGYEYTLPTETQWEYACRAGTNGAFAGNLDDMGWYYDRQPKGKFVKFISEWTGILDADDAEPILHPVGQKNPNAWGFFDMHGNVFEWCRNSDDSPSDDLSPYSNQEVFDPIGSVADGVDGEGLRVIRGGDFECYMHECRSASRASYNADNSTLEIGFRLCLAPVRKGTSKISTPNTEHKTDAP